MQIVEGEHMVVDMRHPLTRDRPPALADVDAGEFEAPEQRGGVDAVERRVVGELGRGEAVVIGENLVEAPLLDEIDREMPAVVAGHEMRRAPRRARRLEKGDALLLAVGGLHDMGERVHRPGVAQDCAPAPRGRIPPRGRVRLPPPARRRRAPRTKLVSGFSRSHAGRTRATESRMPRDWPRKK